MTIEFLEPADVLEIHAEQLSRFGGTAGLRDLGLLESALAQPRATFAGSYLCTGLLVGLTFLACNDIWIDRPVPALDQIVLAVAEGRSGKPEVAALLRRLTSPAPG